MASIKDEKKAFKRLCSADFGSEHTHRVLSKECNVSGISYRAYISGFGGDNKWFGWCYAADLSVVDLCISKAKEVIIDGLPS